ncbi:MAG TPA: hypothetical protein VHF23_07910 [Gaiellaceae bacterium]|nr:hypothetical protein [Gaiellaceae bacterium]
MRAVNDQIREVSMRFASEDGLFLCECGAEDCSEAVLLTIREYDALRARRDGSLVVAAAHRVPV